MLLFCICYLPNRVTGIKCAAHGVDLLIKDCGKLKFFAIILKRINSVVKFVKNHHATSAIYANHTNLKLITPAATRFATHVIVAMRMLKASTVLFFDNTKGMQIFLFAYCVCVYVFFFFVCFVCFYLLHDCSACCLSLPTHVCHCLFSVFCFLFSVIFPS